MNRALTVGTALQDISEKFRRRMRTLCWETLDEGVMLFFRAKTLAEQVKQAAQIMPVGSLHLLAR
ncbi:MAG: hypothetical protein HQL87_04765 [Magnetococcales bacterium]|nr:hypothetical protein [Magnetococcales bacterium]